MTQSEFNILYHRRRRWVIFWKKKMNEVVRERRSGKFNLRNNKIIIIWKNVIREWMIFLLSKTEDMGYFEFPKIYVQL